MTQSKPQLLNDKLMMSDMLMHLKDLMTTSGMALKESNCEKMRALVTSTSGRTTVHQFDLFQYMNKNGMYPIKNAPPTDLKETIAMFAKK